jgi:hypothetical protein
MTMDRKKLDLAVVLAYAVAVLLSALFIQSIAAPVAIFGAFAVAGWFSFVRPALKARERRLDNPEGEYPRSFE